MATTAQYLQQLSQDLTNLKQAAATSGIEISENDTFTTLATKFAGAGGIDNYISSTITKGQQGSNGITGGWAKTLQEYRNEQTISGASGEYMFYHFPLTKTPKLNGTSSLTNTKNMFYQNYDLEEIDLTNFDATNIVFANYMFAENPQLIKLDTSKISFDSLTSAPAMFSQCIRLQQVDLSCFANSPLTNVSYLFSSCTSLKSVDGSMLRFDETSAANSLERMFMSCSSLTSVDIRNLKLTKSVNTSYMFYGCKNLMHIDIRGFDFTNVTSYSNMFGGNAATGVPNDCEIIVKDDTAKTWVTTKFSRLTNVKTVAEYEAEE